MLCFLPGEKQGGPPAPGKRGVAGPTAFPYATTEFNVHQIPIALLLAAVSQIRCKAMCALRTWRAKRPPSGVVHAVPVVCALAIALSVSAYGQLPVHSQAASAAASQSPAAPLAEDAPSNVPLAQPTATAPATEVAAPAAPTDGTPTPTSLTSSAAPPAPPADLWGRLRRGMRLTEPGGEAGQRVAQQERWYRQNATHMQRTFTRARLYLYDIVEAVERDGMPLEIALLPAVESAFIPEARSHAAAEGLWQFIAPTARRFDLKLHLFQDDRRSVRAATQAALRYLGELQARYGRDYQLALAAYNCGEGCIDKAVRRAKAQGLPGRFEDLKLNSETADYVPRLLGLARVVAQAVDADARAAASLPAMANAPYFVAVPMTRDMDVKLAAELAGLSIADFRALNPQHKRPVIVAAASAEVLPPVEREARFREALELGLHV